MGKGGAGLLRVLAALGQLVLCAFFISVYVREQQHLTIVVTLTVLLIVCAVLLFQPPWLPVVAAFNALVGVLLWAGALNRATWDAALKASLLSLPGLVVAALWLHDRRGHQASQAAGVRVGAEQPEGWTKEWGEGRVNFAFILGVGLLMLISGVPMMSSGPLTMGVVVFCFGLALVAVAPNFRTWHRGGRLSARRIAERGGEVGVVFPYSRTKMLAASTGGLGMSIACGALGVHALQGLGGEDRAVMIVVGIFGFFFFGYAGIVSLRRNGGGAGGYIALLESGILTRFGASRFFVPWDAIASVHALEMTVYTQGGAAHEPFVGLMISDMERVEMSRLAKSLIRANRSLADADVIYPVRALDVEPRKLLDAISYYWENPIARPDLSTGRLDLPTFEEDVHEAERSRATSG